MSHRSGIPSVKTTHSDSSPTTETHSKDPLFSLSLSPTSSYNLISPFFLFTSSLTFSHSVTCTPPFFSHSPLSYLVSVSLHFPQHWSLIQGRDNYKFIIKQTPANPPCGCVYLTYHVNPLLCHPLKCCCRLVHHFIIAITSPSLLVAKHCCPHMHIRIPSMHVYMHG